MNPFHHATWLVAVHYAATVNRTERAAVTDLRSDLAITTDATGTTVTLAGDTDRPWHLAQDIADNVASLSSGFGKPDRVTFTDTAQQ